MSKWNYKGIIPAMQCPFGRTLASTSRSCASFAAWLAGHDGVVAVMTNGHTGEVFSLTAERARRGHAHRRRRASRASCRSSRRIVLRRARDAVEHARMARDAGATALDVMPPHHWLRFGFTPEHVVEYFDAIRPRPALDLVVHVYPAWTRASYSSQLLAELARLPWVQAFKVGTARHEQVRARHPAIREADAEQGDPHLPRRVPARVDGAGRRRRAGRLRLVHSAAASSTCGAPSRPATSRRRWQLQAVITPLKDVVYGGGEPTGEAHARMKTAMALRRHPQVAGRAPPTNLPTGADLAKIRDAVRNAGLLVPEAA